MGIDFSTPGLRIMPAELPQPAAMPATSAAIEPSGESSFGDILQNAVASVDNLSLDARYKMSSLIQGGGGAGGADVPDTMIAVQKADLSFQLMLQVRNKVVQAYQQVAGMQF